MILRTNWTINIGLSDKITDDIYPGIRGKYGKRQSFNITNMRNFFAKENMEKLFADCPTITLKKNECIYATEQILTDVFWVSQGMVEVFITNEQGHKQVCRISLSGQYCRRN